MLVLSEKERRNNLAIGSLRGFSVVPQPTVLLSCVLACDALCVVGIGPVWTNIAAQGLLGVWLVLSAFVTAGKLAGYVDLGLLRPSWACCGYVSAQMLAIAVSMTNLYLRLKGRSEWEAHTIGLNVFVIFLSSFASRLARAIEADRLWDDSDDCIDE